MVLIFTGFKWYQYQEDQPAIQDPMSYNTNANDNNNANAQLCMSLFFFQLENSPAARVIVSMPGVEAVEVIVWFGCDFCCCCCRCRCCCCCCCCCCCFDVVPAVEE